MAHLYCRRSSKVTTSQVCSVRTHFRFRSENRENIPCHHLCKTSNNTTPVGRHCPPGMRTLHPAEGEQAATLCCPGKVLTVLLKLTLPLLSKDFSSYFRKKKSERRKKLAGWLLLHTDVTPRNSSRQDS